MPLGDRFMTGVWYEVETGDFVTFDRDDEGETVIICDEEGDELDRIAFVDFHPEDYYPVREEAVDNPVNYFEREVSKRMESAMFDASFQYANERTEVVESDD
jgi:hypothetical protein